jgi:hypothetical protein
MSFERSMEIGKKGYCLVPGHPVQHELTVECWGKLRNWLYFNPNGTESQYRDQCKGK